MQKFQYFIIEELYFLSQDELNEYGSKIQKIIVSKSVKDLYISDSNLVKKLNVKSKKTKVSIDPNLTSIIRTQFDMGTYAKKKSGNYTWSKPYFKLVSNDDGNYKKQISYLVKYKKNGKSKTKTVKKNKEKKVRNVPV